jgi:hypothetical protein
VIVRLQATGELDTLYGNDGLAWVDLESDGASYAFVHDMTPLSDGGALLAGGDYNRPFVARLQGNSGAGGPGVIGVATSYVQATERDGEATLFVRRTGGSSGEVTVSYSTSDQSSATEGQDYTAKTGELHWADGDTEAKPIVVAIGAGDTTVEGPEYFSVTLARAQGVAGLGSRSATVEIAADGSPAGQFSIWTSGTVNEGDAAQVYVSRDYYSQGAVSVVVTPVAVSAGADDFTATPVTVTWADGESGTKMITISTTNDTIEEHNEMFSVELSSPTGGAILGTQATASIDIAASDRPPPSSSGGGSGRFGLFSLLLLGATRLVRSLPLPAGARSRNAQA